MAKRKRKMTLFDVINTGQPIGLQVRQRVPTYQPTPELPVKKKLAKLFGRKPATNDPDRPLSAAEELELLRRELGATKPAAPAEPMEAPAASYEPAEPEWTPEPFDPPPAPPRAARSRVAELAAAAEEAERVEAPPREPRKPISQSLRERWEIVAPKVAAARAAIIGVAASLSTRGFHSSSVFVTRLREYGGRYAVTAGAAAGVIIVLTGAFYTGKLLLNRPAVELPGSELAGNEVRPDVLKLDNGAGARANEPIANVSSRATETRLERKPEQPVTGAFGGRRLDMNYVIVQSYNTQAEAEAAVDVLNKHGIKTTVEMNLPRWAPAGKNLYSVVSADGFTKMGGNEAYQAFLNAISRISDKEANNTLPRRLDPRPYRYQPNQPQ